MTEELAGSIPSKENPPLEGRILNLASGESGIVSANEADAIIAASLDECALGRVTPGRCNRSTPPKIENA